jgi:class 3 adenylate cyclase
MLLLIADIGGYTRFMTVHRVNLSHAQVIVAELLEAVIDAASPTFKLSKLEGDAAFFYAKLDDRASFADIAQRVAGIRHAFVRRRSKLDDERLCTCDPCTQTGQLRIKFAVHAGEVALQRVKRFTELAGVPVIVVHRMLKNHVPISEYVLLTEELVAALPDAVRGLACAIDEDLEGIGSLTLHYIDLSAIDSGLAHGAHLQVSLLSRLIAWLRLTIRSLPFFVGAETPCAGFHNLSDARGSTPGLPPSTPYQG